MLDIRGRVLRNFRVWRFEVCIKKGFRVSITTSPQMVVHKEKDPKWGLLCYMSFRLEPLEGGLVA